MTMHRKLIDAAVDALWDAVQSGDKKRIELAREALRTLLEPLFR